MLFYQKPYPISKNKFLVIKKYINKHFYKGFICPSISQVTTLIFLLRSQKRVFDFVLIIEDLILL